jgi:hypothetical protein
VAKGFSQTQGIDFGKIYASITKINNIITMLSKTIAKDMEIVLFDT